MKQAEHVRDEENKQDCAQADNRLAAITPAAMAVKTATESKDE
jgi:hypothetical protein